MQIFNTLTRQKEEFVPQVPGEYRIYVCGPTVYNYIHIGNARPLIVFDTLRRYLEYRGNKVIYVYAGIFEATGFLDTTQSLIARLEQKITPYGSVLLTATITSMATCNQTLSSILTYQLHKDSAANNYQLALDLENSTIVVAALIPWSIACAVPLATIGAGNAGSGSPFTCICCRSIICCGLTRSQPQ